MTEKQVTDLQSLLRTDASIDSKVNLVNTVKSSIKQHNVPDSCVAPLFDALRTASSSQHAMLVNAGFTALNHLLTRLSRQEPKYLAKEAMRTLPLIIEKLGDQKEKFRSIALQALVTLYAPAPAEVERSIRNSAMAGKNPRAKEASLQWLLQVGTIFYMEGILNRADLHADAPGEWSSVSQLRPYPDGTARGCGRDGPRCC